MACVESRECEPRSSVHAALSMGVAARVSSDTVKLRATSAGLALCFFGPPLVAAASARLASPVPAPGSAFAFLLALAAIPIGVVTIALAWERLSVSEIGLKRPTWHSFVTGSALASFFVLVFGPLAVWVFASFERPGFAEGVARTATLPSWYLIPSIVVVGATEEILYRGYAIQRLAVCTGSWRIGAAISTVGFALAHVPLWGWITSVSFLVSGGLLAAFYVWRRDLNANIIAHVITDIVGLALAPSGPV